MDRRTTHRTLGTTIVGAGRRGSRSLLDAVRRELERATPLERRRGANQASDSTCARLWINGHEASPNPRHSYLYRSYD